AGAHIRRDAVMTTAATVKTLESSESLKELYAALVEAAANAKAVEKDSTNSYHKYKYASAEAIMDEARGALTSAGLHALTVGWEFVPRAVEATGPDGEARMFGGVAGRMVVRYRLVHKSGEWLDFELSTPVIPEKGRPEDKAEATALAYNAGYFLRGLLML